MRSHRPLVKNELLSLAPHFGNLSKRLRSHFTTIKHRWFERSHLITFKHRWSYSITFKQRWSHSVTFKQMISFHNIYTEMIRNISDTCWLTLSACRNLTFMKSCDIHFRSKNEIFLFLHTFNLVPPIFEYFKMVWSWWNLLHSFLSWIPRGGFAGFLNIFLVINLGLHFPSKILISLKKCGYNREF